MKIKQHSTDPKKVSIKQARRELDNEIAISDNGKRERPINPEYITNLAKDLLLMFDEDDKMITMLPWKKKHNLTTKKIEHYLNINTEFKEKVEEFRECVGLRAFEKGFYRAADPTFAAKAFGMYNQEYRAYIAWQNDLKKEVAKEGNGSKDVVLVGLKTFHETGVVPDKVTHDRA